MLFSHIFFWCEVICLATIGAMGFLRMTSVVRFFIYAKEDFNMKKARKPLSLILIIVMILSIIVISPSTASAAVSSRNDGNWFFPLPQNYYKSFTDWAGCNASPGATGACPFHGRSCLIGCGAYGYLLASEIKKMGKGAIQTCGSTQMFFGVLGKRWTADKTLMDEVVNQYWIRPSMEERPESFQKVEGGCYW